MRYGRAGTTATSYLASRGPDSKNWEGWAADGCSNVCLIFWGGTRSFWRGFPMPSVLEIWSNYRLVRRREPQVCAGVCAERDGGATRETVDCRDTGRLAVQGAAHWALGVEGKNRLRIV